MQESDWPSGGAVKNDSDEEIVQLAVDDDDARQAIVEEIEACGTECDHVNHDHLTALLAEVDRRRRVREHARPQRAPGRRGQMPQSAGVAR